MQPQTAFESEGEQNRARDSTGVPGTWHGKGSMLKARGAARLSLASLPMDCLLTDVARAACEDPEQRVQLLHSSPAHLVQPAASCAQALSCRFVTRCYRISFIFSNASWSSGTQM